MFEPFLIVVFESLNCLQCEKDGSQNHTVTAGKGIKYAKNAGKLQNLQNVEICLKNSAQFNCSRTNKGLMNNQHKTKEQSWIIQVTTQY